ncbi:MAG: winged helix-turn-helix transcriptional regulator [Ethanoligenens sp.]
MSPKIEYSLFKKGLTLMPVRQCLCEWIQLHIHDSSICGEP